VVSQKYAGNESYELFTSLNLSILNHTYVHTFYTCKLVSTKEHVSASQREHHVLNGKKPSKSMILGDTSTGVT